MKNYEAGAEGVEQSPAEKIAGRMLDKIAEARTTEELLQAIDRALVAADMMGTEVSYAHPNGPSVAVDEQFRSLAEGYIDAARSGDENRMYALSDSGLPPQLKEKARELAETERTESPE